MQLLTRLLPTSTYRLLSVLLLGTLLAAANAQEEEETPDNPDDTAETAEDSSDTPPAEETDLGPDDPLLDVQGFDPNDDDDFVPSEDIPADAPIAFPTDI